MRLSDFFFHLCGLQTKMDYTPMITSWLDYTSIFLLTMFLRLRLWLLHKTLDLGKTLHFVWKSLGGILLGKVPFPFFPLVLPFYFVLNLSLSFFPGIHMRTRHRGAAMPLIIFFSLFYIYYFIMLHVTCFIPVISTQTSGTLSKHFIRIYTY